jgi:hypothetical protein
MGKGSSESSTTTQSTSSTTNADQRVAAEGGGVAIGAGAEYSYSPSEITTYEFPSAVADFANKLLSFAGDILGGANETLRAALASNEAVVNAGFASGTKAISEAQETALAAVSPTTANTNSIMTNLIPIAIVGGIVLIVVNLFKKRG